MKTIDLYIIRKFLGTFFYAISLLILVVIIFDVSENIDEFIDKEAPLNAIIFDYYVNFIPYFVNLFSYLFTFISVIYFTSKMAANTEIIAILSSGISFWQMLRPYFISAIILALISFYLANFLIPYTSQKRRTFADRYIQGLTKNKDEHIHLQVRPGVFVYMESFNKSNNNGYRFTGEKFEDTKLVYKISAERIVWDTTTSKWRIENFTERIIKDSVEYIRKGSRLDTALNLTPSELFIKKEFYEEMTFSVLNNFIEQEELKGSPEVVFYKMEKYNRLASPFATLVMTLIGVSLSSRKIRGGTGMHLGLGILLTFTYILFMRITTVFATYGNLPPPIAAWVPNVIFLIIGLYLLKTAPK